ncbi:LysR family transcriptional regulator [Allofrancisella guangzhouensis]|uniref:LysR family transcriptional regulator n=1 Tax=Allofrancisella guangzhouensis TaxID=594679 RepID=A0A0A8E3J5_9GAMM|nr:LysR substrate-binding domain-containing protein [Allofrancisella guangzhouensis]AJC48177.1 LysR family transcriptional regulator [Allofrancisella guangzhouensis]MBK2027043.1 LysR family transcriptional regulator [Allofrancisella guangzhouensis]MBK2044533.1 LysR family transcriptional regulator [Allofrancisella guangzhouensis]MBK2046135.1 LysR family transcriptional regulator [Allofrancisella guangzhouensis]
MRITLKQLRVFVNTAKTESISIGAEKCFISQAAASMSLSQLENMLGITLFDRLGKRMKLNSNGQALLTQAVQIIDRVSELESFTCEGKPLTGKITIGASTTIANYILPKYIAQFRNLYPNIDIELICDNTKEIIHTVETLTCDVGFIEGECSSNHINSTVWKEDNLVIISNKNHPLVNKKDLKIADLLKYNWVTREQGSGTFEVFSRATKDYLPQLKKEISFNNTEAIKLYISNSQCLTYLSQTIVEQAWNTAQYQILDVKDLNLKRNFYKLLHKTKYHTKLVGTFCQFLEKENI